MARASSSSSCTEMVKSSLRRVLRLSHLEDIHGLDAGGSVPFLGSLWILKVTVVEIRPGRKIVRSEVDRPGDEIVADCR